jgi:HTH-type transcriptional regulator / antitoxin HigA
MEKMALKAKSSSAISPVKYGKLLAQTLPKRIESEVEFEGFVAAMEKLSRAIEHGRATPEEVALHSLLAMLIREYDDRVAPAPPGDPVETIRFLMDQRELRPVDLEGVFGARSITSMVLSGKREISKTHIRKLAEFFHVSPVLFLGQ